MLLREPKSVSNNQLQDSRDMSQPTPGMSFIALFIVNVTLVPQNEMTKIVPFTYRVNNIEEDKEPSEKKSRKKSSNRNQSDNDDFNWGNESVKSESKNQEEFKSHPLNLKSNNVEDSKNSENIHDM